MPVKKTPTLETVKRNALMEAARSSIVDEAGRLEAKLAPFKGDIKRLEDVRKTIREWYDLHEATLSFTVAGSKYVATVGPRGNQTVIFDLETVLEAAGKTKFLAAVKLSQDSLKAIVDPAIASAVTTTAQTGSRPLSLLDVRPDK